MHLRKNILAVIGGNYNSRIDQIEHYLPLHLSRYHNVTVFEYPRICRTLTLLANRDKLIENLNKRLSVFHSFAVFPFGRTFIIFNFLNHLLNYWLMKYFMKKKYDLIIALTPEAALQPNPGKIPLIYHVLDEYSALPWWNNRPAKRQLLILEKKTVTSCCKIITVSERLKEKYEFSKKPVFVFPTPAANEYYFDASFKNSAIPHDLKKIPKPIIGFAGSVTFKNKIPEKLLTDLFEALPGVSFVFIGLISPKAFNFRQYEKKYGNFHYLGLKQKENLPKFISRFDVGIIPYQMSEYGQAAYPVKIMEYLAAGIPVVATDLPSFSGLKDKKVIYTAKSQSEFIEKCRIAIKENNRSLRLKRIDLAKNFSWSNKIKEYLQLIEI